MKKLKKILKLSDPYPNLWYEFSCYLKTILGLGFLILGAFLLYLGQIAGIFAVFLGLGIFWQIKLVRKFIRTLEEKFEY